MDFSDAELGPKMQACNERERKFAWALATGMADNATEAARLAGYTDPGPESSAIRVRGHQLIHRERVIEAIEEIARREFRALIVPALASTRRLLTKPDHPDHAKTVQSMLSRLGFGERTGVDVNVSGEVAVNHTDAAVNDLRILKNMGLSRDRLVDIFGFSGLERYEKMLASNDAKLIEHKSNE